MRSRTIRGAAVLLAVVGVALASASRAALLVTFDSPISGDAVPVTLALADAPGGDAVDVTVTIPSGAGDLLGLFGNVVDETLLPAMAVQASSGIVTQWQFEADRVWKVGGGNTLSPVKEWDWGLRFGAQGSGGGAVEAVSFRLAAPDLTVAQLVEAVNQGWAFGVRIQGTGGPEGSAKIGLSGQAPRIRIDAPADGALLNHTPTAVLGVVFGAGVAVDVNGVPAAVAGQGFAADVPLVEGSNTLLATGVNAWGAATDSVDVVLDTTPPRVTITAPPDGTLTSEAEAAVTGTVEDASPIASFTLNGVAVALVDGAFGALVPLAVGANPIEAVAVDAAGNQGSDAVSVVRGAPPAISIESPAAGALLSASPVTVTGSVDGMPAPSVVVNGVVASVSGGTFSAVVPLVEGPNTLAATATNAFGEASDEVGVTLDTTPPVVTIIAPADGSRTTEAQTLVTGTVIDASPIAGVTVNGVPAALAGSGFSATVPLAQGASTLTATAVDAAGHQGSDAVAVTRGEPPTIAISTPASGATLDASPVTVSGPVSGTPPVSVHVNGVTASVAGGSYTASVPLQDGPNTITATASNDFGQAAASVAVTLSAEAPLSVQIVTPPDGATVSSSAIAVTGVVSDPEAVVSVNGVAAAVAGNAWVAAPVRVVEGPNVLTAVATRDAATASDASTVLFNLPPKIVITSPPDGAVLRVAETDVEGFVDDPTAFVDVNGVSAEVASAGRFVARGVPLSPGPNQLTARAVDPQGATGKDEVRVTRDDTSAGRMRIVLVVPDRQPRPSGLEDFPDPVVVVAEDAAEFGEALRGLGMPPERFDPAIEAPAFGFNAFYVHLFVFAEAGVVGGPVAVPALSAVFELDDEPQLLRAMADLDDDLQEAELDASLRDQIVPADFIANGFARFTLFFGFPE